MNQRLVTRTTGLTLALTQFSGARAAVPSLFRSLIPLSDLGLANCLAEEPVGIVYAQLQDLRVQLVQFEDLLIRGSECEIHSGLAAVVLIVAGRENHREWSTGLPVHKCSICGDWGKLRALRRYNHVANVDIPGARHPFIFPEKTNSSAEPFPYTKSAHTLLPYYSTTLLLYCPTTRPFDHSTTRPFDHSTSERGSEGASEPVSQ